jgi:hypothetical protein
MATFRKYEFAVYADFRTINDLEVEPRSVVELGHINEQNPKAWCVDVLWEGNEPKHWANYQTWPKPCGVHSFLGWDAQYEADYQEFATPLK